MRTIKSDAFNETLVSLLRELEATINSIPPEAIQLLPVELVDKARKFTEDEFRLDRLATVNSIGGYKLNSMIRHITANNFEFYYGSQRIINTAEENWDSNGNTWVGLVARDTIILPDGWDGRKGFAMFRRMKSVVIFRSTKYGVEAKPLNAKALITQNERTIEVDVHRNWLRQKNGAMFWEDATTTSYLIVDYVLWRRKNV